MNRKKQLYQKLVTKNRYIAEDYSDYKETHRNSSKIALYCKILSLNIKYRVFRRPYKEKTQELIDEVYLADAAAFSGATPKEIVLNLLSYDIISFDIFYTLVFRPFLKPDDFFDILAAQYNIINFKKIRLEAEHKAHSISKKRNSEADIFDIYKIIEEETGIPAETGVSNELLLEKKYITANEFMLEVFALLKKSVKKVILVYDMYLPKNYLQ